MQRPDSVLLDQFEFVAFVAFHYRVFDLPLELKSIVLKKKTEIEFATPFTTLTDGFNLMILILCFVCFKLILISSSSP